MQKKTLLKKLNLAQKTYENHFLGMEFLYVYEEKGKLKDFRLIFNLSHFKHLTGIITEEYNPRNFYRALKENKIDTNYIFEGTFTSTKLNHFHELTDIIYSPAIYYKFAPEKGNANWLYIDSFISKKTKRKSTILGITNEKNNKYSPSSLLYDTPERKGTYKGKVLLIGVKRIGYKGEYNTVFRVSNISNITSEIKKKFKNLENYNCLTGNILHNFSHVKGENRWISKEDIKENNLQIKEKSKYKISTENPEENKLCSKLVIYYNLTSIESIKEIESKLVSIKK